MKCEVKLLFGDCIERMKELDDRSIHLVLTDMPYGITKYKWDTPIPLGLMWFQLNRIVKEDGAICLFGKEPFSSVLRVSNLEMFKYDWIWRKDRASGHLNVNKQPMRRLEIISVFYSQQCRYFPQLRRKKLENIKWNDNTRTRKPGAKIYGEMSKQSVRAIPVDLTYPYEVLEFKSNFEGQASLYPTQKPVALLEYFLRTYTVEGDTVLDFTMGSGSTGVACKNLNRNFIGIDNSREALDIANKRINYGQLLMNFGV